MKKDDLKIKKDIQLKCPELTDDVLELLTEYLIIQVSNKLKKDAKKFGLLSIVSDKNHCSYMSQMKNGVGFFMS